MRKLRLLLAILVLFNCKADLDILQEAIFDGAESKVNLIFPESNQECTAGVIVSDTESEVLFEWTNAEPAIAYQLTLTNLTTLEESLFNSETNSLLIRLLRGTPYSWKVITLLEDSSQNVSSDTEFFYNAGPGLQFFVPFPATNVAPLNNSVLPATELVSLQWQAEDLDEDIINYDIYLDNITPPALFESNIETNFLNNIEVSNGTTYFWKVVTKDAQANKSTSATFTFKID